MSNKSKHIHVLQRYNIELVLSNHSNHLLCNCFCGMVIVVLWAGTSGFIIRKQYVVIMNSLLCAQQLLAAPVAMV